MTNQTADELNTKFKTGGLTFKTDENSMVIAEISNKLCTASLTLHGAHILSYIPKDQKEVVFVSREAIFKEGVPVRGGIPVCWPWFGDHLSDNSVYSHGFARRNMWNVKNCLQNSDGSTSIILSLGGKQNQYDSWPFDFEAEIEIQAGSTLTVSLTSINVFNEPFTITNALHTYFNISDTDNIFISGLDGVTYQDDVDSEKIKKQSGDIIIDREVDRVYMSTEGNCVITDKGFNREIHISKKGSATTVVWNPWIDNAKNMKDMADDEYKKMVCIEAVNTFDDKQKIVPGSKHTITQIIKVKSI